MDGLKKVEWTSMDREEVGSTLHAIAEEPDVKGEMDVEITEVIKNEKGAWRTIGGNLTAFGFAALSSTKTGTKLTIMMDYELPHSVLGKIVNKLLVHKEFENSYKRDLKKLKDMLEK